MMMLTGWELEEMWKAAMSGVARRIRERTLEEVRGILPHGIELSWDDEGNLRIDWSKFDASR